MSTRAHSDTVNFTLIQCTGTLDPRMHRCVERTRVIDILILMYLHVLEYGCCHLVASWMDILFREASA